MWLLSCMYVIVVHSECTLQPKMNFSLWDNKVYLILLWYTLRCRKIQISNQICYFFNVNSKYSYSKLYYISSQKWLLKSLNTIQTKKFVCFISSWVYPACTVVVAVFCFACSRQTSWERDRSPSSTRPSSRTRGMTCPSRCPAPRRTSSPSRQRYRQTQGPLHFKCTEG